MYNVKAVYKQNNKYYVYDDPETGKWTFPGIELQNEDPEKGVVKLVRAMIEETGTAPLGLELDHTTEHTHPSSEKVFKTHVYLVEDWAGDLKLNTVWQLLPASELLRTGNVDAVTREYLEKVRVNKTALYQLDKLRKEASGPTTPHRSVSAVVQDEKGKVLLMEHPYQKIYSIPKGHIDDNENARSAIVRELEEELGITVKPEDAVLVTWYVETYRNKDVVTPVKHYIYSIKGYEGKVRNAEKERFGNIKMVWADPEDIKKMKDVSFMTVKAAELLTKKGAGFLGTLPLTFAAGLAIPSLIRMAVPSTRRADAKSLENNWNDLKRRYNSTGINDYVSDIYNKDWEKAFDDTVIDADKAVRPVRDRVTNIFSNMV